METDNNQNYKDRVCMYLRKSRADIELEKTGEMETLARHEGILKRYAKENNINIINIKKELETADSIFARPKMIELMQEIEEGKYTGVLVMEMQRLCRGDMSDQALMIDTFKNSNTVIITKNKVYNLSNELDETYTEFETFMSRQEYRIIKSRLSNGKLAAVREGNYIATFAPFGYDIKYNKRERFLVINESEAEIVRMIFNMYNGGLGSRTITNKLNYLGFKSRSGIKFSPTVVLNVLKNSIYKGEIVWRKKIGGKDKNGNRFSYINKNEDDIIRVRGKHEPIIDEKLFDSAQKILNSNLHISYPKTAVNPLAGLIVCTYCKQKMVLRLSNGIQRIMCPDSCMNISNRFDEIEALIIQKLSEYYDSYKIDIAIEEKQSGVNLLMERLNEEMKIRDELIKQRINQYDLLEKKIYTEVEFKERLSMVSKKIRASDKMIASLREEISKNNKQALLIPDIKHFKNMLDGYIETNSIEQKNIIMKKILLKAEYEKTSKENINITIYPKLYATD